METACQATAAVTTDLTVNSDTTHYNSDNVGSITIAGDYNELALGQAPAEARDRENRKEGRMRGVEGGGESPTLPPRNE